MFDKLLKIHMIDLFYCQIGQRRQYDNGPRCEKNCLRDLANNKGADQPAHLQSLLSAFVICFLESTICKLATGEISIF